MELDRKKEIRTLVSPRLPATTGALGSSTFFGAAFFSSFFGAAGAGVGGGGAAFLGSSTFFVSSVALTASFFSTGVSASFSACGSDLADSDEGLPAGRGNELELKPVGSE